MMDLGPHTIFIVAAYGFVAVVLGGLIGWLWLDGRSLARQLAELEARGIRRRSSGGAGSDGKR